jgi:phospholipase A2
MSSANKKLKLGLLLLTAILPSITHGFDFKKLAGQAQAGFKKAQQTGERELKRVQQVGMREFKKAEKTVSSAVGTVIKTAKKEVSAITVASEKGLTDLKIAYDTTVDAAIDAVTDPAKASMRAKFNTDNAYKDTPSQVYNETNFQTSEANVIARRLPIVQANTAKFLTGKLPETVTLSAANTPHIGIVASGGGYRAMIATLGFLMGLEKIGVLDSTLYMSALSGSTWMLASWNSLNLNLADLNTYLRNYSYNSQQILDPITDQTQIQKIANNLTRKQLFNNPVSSVDLYGALLANKLFGSLPNRQNIYLADQAAIINDGTRIFPIYTAVEPVTKDQYRWYEFTPFTFGSADLNQYIDIWAMGRIFQNGQAKKLLTLDGEQYGPDVPLGFILGICGSAYTVSLDEMIALMEKSPLSPTQRLALTAIKAHASLDAYGDWRAYPALASNFMSDISGNPLSSAKEIKLVDAGLDSNLPFMPLVGPRRKLDILIALDASNPINAGEALQISEKRAHERGYKFPKIDYSNLNQRSFTVFADADPETPIVIYIPLIRDATLSGLTDNPILKQFDPQICANTSFCSTFNFKYSSEQFEQLRQSAEFNIVANGANFWNAIKDAVLRKTK